MAAFKLLSISLILTVPLPTDRLRDLDKHPYLRKGQPFLKTLRTISLTIALSLLVTSVVAAPAIVTEIETVKVAPTNAVTSIVTKVVTTNSIRTNTVPTQYITSKGVATKDVATKDVATKKVPTKDISKSPQYDDRPAGKPCGKFEPMTNEIWENGVREKMTEWLRQQKAFYDKTPRGTSFTNFLLEKFFPSSAQTVKSASQISTKAFELSWKR
ncbi:hypothetical protein SLS56_004057 [Neofusicoccum ribis]|uniref:Uncharacterized protein n=1 Tax=Neofusicoccum ribis TaxID=45134 RepID=A0ABR3SY34_9PEZI